MLEHQAISARPHTFFRRVAAIDVREAGAKEDVEALYDELVALKEQLKPQDLIRACMALFPKANPFSDNGFKRSITFQLVDMNNLAIKQLAGWEKAAAKMCFYELLNEHRVCLRRMVIPKEGLSPAERVKRQEWLDTTGFWITHRWSIWKTTSLEAVKEKFNELKALIQDPACCLTVDQRLDLLNEYREKFRRLMDARIGRHLRKIDENNRETHQILTSIKRIRK